MQFMNTGDIEQAKTRHADHPILGPATTTLDNLAEWANQNSDGWAYWPKPARAAAKLMAMIDKPGVPYFDFDREDVTVDEYRKALSPIKTFRTRQGADFEIVEVSK